MGGEGTDGREGAGKMVGEGSGGKSPVTRF